MRRDVVLVTGPWLAGVSGVVAALSERMPQHTFIESTDLAAGEAPTAVVFVVSAAAPLTESDCTLLDAAAADTDAVIGAVSKIDVHRSWRDVLAANRDELAAARAALPQRALGRRRRRCPTAAIRRSTTWSPPYANSSPTPISPAETGCGRGNHDCRTSPNGTIGTPTARAGERGWRHYASSAAASCGSGGCRSRSARSRCAARPSRPGCSCRTSPATDVPRCAASCRRTRRVWPGAGCRCSRPYTRGRVDEVVAEVDEGNDHTSGRRRAKPGAGGRPAGIDCAAEVRDAGPAAEVAAAGDPADDAGGRRFRAWGGVDAEPVGGRPDARV